MTCKKCGKKICVEEAASCRGYCFACYWNWKADNKKKGAVPA